MAISFTPGQTVAAPDWEALFQQHGGSKSTVQRPMTKAEQDAALDAGDDPVQNPIYRYYAADGSYVEARKAPNGDYLIVGYQPSEKFQQTQKPPTAAAGQKPTGGREVTEGTPDPSKPGGYDNERPRKVIRDASGKEVWSEELTGAELTAWRESRERSRNPGGKTDAQIAAEGRANEPKPRQTRPNPSDPTRIQEFDPTANGGTGAWVDAGPNAAGVQAQQPKRTEKPVQGKDGKQYTEVTETDPKTGKTRTYYTDASGKEVPLPGDPQIPTNAPQFTPNWQKPGLGIIEYASAVRARPDLTDEQKAKLIQEAHTMATATVSQGNAVLSAQQTEASRQTTERGQDVGMANQRLSSSSSNFGTAVRQAAEDTKYSLGSEAASVLPYYLALGQASGQAYGGFNTPPAVRPGAAIGQMQGQTIPGLATMLPGSFKPGAPAAPPPAASAPPNAIGVGSVGAVSAPDQAATAAAEAARQSGMAAAASPPPTAGEPGGPPLAPGPVAPTPSMAPGPVPVPSTGAPYTPESANASVFAPTPAPNPYGPQPQEVGQPGDPGYISPTNPDFGSPDMRVLPQAPALRPWTGFPQPPPQPMAPGSPAGGNVQMAPQQGGAGLAAMLGNVGPWGGQPQQPGQPTGLGALMMQRAGGYQPYGLNAMLLQAGLDPDVIQTFGGVG